MVSIQKSSSSSLKGKKDKKTSRPPNCFMIFSQEFRPILQLECPKLSNAEISRLLGERWKKLHPNKKQVYREKAEEIKKNINIPSSPQTQDTSNSKRERENIEQNVIIPEEPVSKKKSRLIQQTNQPDIDFLQVPIDIPHEFVTSGNQEFFTDFNLDFVESLIEVNLALNNIPSTQPKSGHGF